MKKILFLAFSTLITLSLFAQQDSTARRQAIFIGNRSNDHFLIQLGYTKWSGQPDSINTGLSKSLNVYFMFDFPFKTNPKLSMAFGPGIGSDQIVFKKTYVGIKDLTPVLNFTNQEDTTHFKRVKLATTYFEAPIEFRYNSDPLHNGKSFKLAIGLKVGFLMGAHTRNKELEDKSGNTINAYTMKEASKRFFNNNRFCVIGRVGIGHFSLYGSYQVSSLFKDGLAAEVHPYSIGLTLSGL